MVLIPGPEDWSENALFLKLIDITPVIKNLHVNVFPQDCILSSEVQS